MIIIRSLWSPIIIGIITIYDDVGSFEYTFIILKLTLYYSLALKKKSPFSTDQPLLPIWHRNKIDDIIYNNLL